MFSFKHRAILWVFLPCKCILFYLKVDEIVDTLDVRKCLDTGMYINMYYICAVCTCMYVCIYIYIYICTLYVCMYVCTYMYVCSCMYVNMYVNMYNVCVQLCMYVHVYYYYYYYYYLLLLFFLTSNFTT